MSGGGEVAKSDREVGDGSRKSTEESPISQVNDKSLPACKHEDRVLYLMSTGKTRSIAAVAEPFSRTSGLVFEGCTCSCSYLFSRPNSTCSER